MTADQENDPKGMREKRSPIDLANESRFKISGVSIDPAACRLGEESAGVRVEPRVMQVLVALWKSKGETLSRDDLVEMCWSGRSVSDDAVHRCVGALRKATNTFDPQPFVIETLPRVGYRLIVSEAGDASLSSEAINLVEKTGALSERPGRKAAIWNQRRAAIAVGVLVAVLISAALFNFNVAPTAEKLDSSSAQAPISIGVIPFSNVSGIEAHTPFIDGLTVEIIARLGSVKGIEAPGRASSFQFKDTNLPPSEIAKKLNVQYVLDGAVQREGDSIRVTIHLTDGKSGYQLWSKIFDRTTSTLLDLQSDIAREVTAAVPGAVGVSIQRTGQTYVEPRALDLYLNGLGHLRGGFFDSGWPQAHAAFTAAVKLDPDFADANAFLAITITELRPANAANRAKEALAKAAMNAPGTATVLFAQGKVASAFGLDGEGPDLEVARSYFDRSLLLDPTNSEAILSRARIEADPNERLRLMRRAIEIDPLFYDARLELATELANRGLTKEAFDEFQELYVLDPDRGVRGAIELARAGADLEMLGRSAFGSIDNNIVTRPDRLLIAGLLADFGAIEEAQFLYGYPAPDPLLFLPKRREVYLAWLSNDPDLAFEEMAKADYSKIENSSIFGGAVALFAGRADEAISLVLAAYPDLPEWSESRIGDVRALPEIIGAHIYAMALRQKGEGDAARKIFLALIPATHRIYAGEMSAQRRYLSLAILYAQAGDARLAMDELKKARAAGWRYPRTYAWISYAPSPPIDSENGFLAPLRDEPEFRSMMEDIRTENRAALVRFDRQFGFISRLRAMMAAPAADAAGSSPPQ